MANSLIVIQAGNVGGGCIGDSAKGYQQRQADTRNDEANHDRL